MTGRVVKDGQKRMCKKVKCVDLDSLTSSAPFLPLISKIQHPVTV